MQEPNHSHDDFDDLWNDELEDDQESQNDEIPLSVAIQVVEEAFGYEGQSVPKERVIDDVRKLADELRRELAQVDVDNPEPSVIQALVDIIKVSESLTRYADHRSLGVQTRNDAAEVMLGAQRKAGQWLNQHLAEDES